MRAALAGGDDAWLARRGGVVVERSSRSPGPAWARGLEHVADRRYGETSLWFAEPDEKSR